MFVRSLFVACLVVFSIVGESNAQASPSVTVEDLEFCYDTAPFNKDPKGCLSMSAPLAACANRLHRLGPKMIFALLVTVSISKASWKEGEPPNLALREIRKCARGERHYGTADDKVGRK